VNFEHTFLCARPVQSTSGENSLILNKQRASKNKEYENRKGQGKSSQERRKSFHFSNDD
jgi:hypothetical protein